MQGKPIQDITNFPKRMTFAQVLLKEGMKKQPRRGSLELTGKEETDMPDNEILPRLLTVPEVAELLHINAGKVHELRKSGLLPCLKLGAYKCRPDALAMMLQKWEGWDISDPYHPRKMDESA